MPGPIPFQPSAWRSAAAVLLAALVLLERGGRAFAPRTQDVVINEVMYHPPEDLDDLQYVELFNRGKTAVDLSKWTLRGIKYAFPDKTSIAPNSCLVICRNRAAFAAHYGTSITALGDFSGRLSHGGERIELANAAGQSHRYAEVHRQRTLAGRAGRLLAVARADLPRRAGRRSEQLGRFEHPRMERAAGTPGRPNDSFSANPPPAVTQVEFKTPAPNQKITVPQT